MTTPNAPPLTTPVVLTRRQECPMCGNAWETTEALAADCDRLARENAELRAEIMDMGEMFELKPEAQRAEVERLKAQVAQLRAVLVYVDRRGGCGFAVHERVDAALSATADGEVKP